MPTAAADGEWDVAIAGASLAGAATAFLLRQENPRLKILLCEKSPAFKRRVGEATVEVSAYFLSRVLGLMQHLNEAHLVKQGMRFWFCPPGEATLGECSEIGGQYLARVPAFQVDRSVLDEEVLQRAVALGAELWRPASVSKVELSAGGRQIITVQHGGQTRTVRARWFVDASGCAAFLARQEGWREPVPEHPTTAVWARWKGVKDWDGLELTRRFPELAQGCHGIRHTATNHFLGEGWWGWCIPLKGGDVSVGIVFDQRLVQFPEAGALGERLKAFLLQHPVAREVMAGAECVEGDVHWRKNLPYRTTRFAGDGFALVGDAAGFLDPLYSPGMDWIAYTVTASVELILAQQRGEALAEKLVRHDRLFGRSYDRWFKALYRDKYFYLGDFDLMRLAFLLDLGLYYLGVVSQPFKRGGRALCEPVFSTPPSVPFFHFMRVYNRRFARIAAARRARGTWGRHNRGERILFGGFSFTPITIWPIVRALAGWARLELTEGWRTWGQPAPGPAGPAAPPEVLMPVEEIVSERR